MSLPIPFVSLRVQNIATLVRAARVTSTTYAGAAALMSETAMSDDANMQPALRSWYERGAVAHMSRACEYVDGLGFSWRLLQHCEDASLQKVLTTYIRHYVAGFQAEQFFERRLKTMVRWHQRCCRTA